MAIRFDPDVNRVTILLRSFVLRQFVSFFLSSNRSIYVS